MLASISMGYASRLTDSKLYEYHERHLRGVPINALAREVWAEAGYASVESAAVIIRRGFKRLGLSTPSRSTRSASNRKPPLSDVEFVRRFVPGPGRHYQEWHRRLARMSPYERVAAADDRREFILAELEELSNLASGVEANPTRRPGPKRRISDAELVILHHLHVDVGASISLLGQHLFEEKGYASADSAATAIQQGFARLGLKARPRRLASMLSNTKHGMKVAGADISAYQIQWQRSRYPPTPCAGMRRDGKACTKTATRGKQHCYSHDPDRAAERAAHLARVRRIKAGR